MKAFEPLKIRNLKLKNRLVMPPMCMYSACNQDGKVGDFHLAHYTARAIGQVGLIIVEATGVSPEGRISMECLGLWEDAQVPGMARLVGMIQGQGAMAALQLNHAGRKSLTTGRRLAPSQVPYNGHAVTYEAMSLEDIKGTLQAFHDAAARAHRAGFDGLELHAAHGYLIHQFLSPLSNQREDAYGYDRALFLKQVVEAVAAAWPSDKALWLRISATDWLPGSVSPEDWLGWLPELPRPMDMVHVSSGGLQKAQVSPYPGYMLPLAKAIKQGSGLQVIGVGLIREDQLIHHALESGSCDLLALGRELLRSPNRVCQLAESSRCLNVVPPQYARAYREEP